MSKSIITIDKDYIIKDIEENVHPNFRIVAKNADYKFLDCIHPGDVVMVRNGEEGVIRLKTSISSYEKVKLTVGPEKGQITLESSVTKS